MIYDNVLGTIGNTPLVRLNRVCKDIKGQVVVKIEAGNPGHSIKDRIAVQLIEDAEAEGKLKPGGTIIEATSGNTGMGLAITAIVKGYKCIFTTNDKQSKEKIDILRAMGAEVIVCPTAVSADDPRSYYSVAERLNKDIPNSYYPDQYNNLSNTKTHYEQTGPEIWEATEGQITHLVVGVGTGGTISGTAKYLKEQNPAVQIVGLQPEDGSAIPGIRRWPQEYLPTIFDARQVDLVMDISQQEAEHYMRELARREGIF